MCLFRVRFLLDHGITGKLGWVVLFLLGVVFSDLIMFSSVLWSRPATSSSILLVVVSKNVYRLCQASLSQEWGWRPEVKITSGRVSEFIIQEFLH